MSDGIIHVIPVSTGKDSSATAVLALETEPRESLRFVSADTDNESERFPEYLDYMERHLNIRIDRVKASFAEEIARKRDYVAKHWPRKGVPATDVERALRALVPTGNAYVDLCLWKGRFPSRTQQFCTEQLKVLPMTEYELGFLERGEASAVWVWQGIRADESLARRNKLHLTGHFYRHFEEVGGGLYNYRPIPRWTAADCFEAMALVGLEPNPLYKEGFLRVGCFPCINEDKDGVLNISKRYPHHIERIEYWEATVGLASKGGEATFFAAPERSDHLKLRGIRNYVEWAKTKRGGQLMDWIRIHEEPKACESAYGLCE